MMTDSLLSTVRHHQPRRSNSKEKKEKDGVELGMMSPMHRRLRATK